MSSWKQQFFGFVAITGIYIGILALFLPQQLTKYNVLSLGIALISFSLSSLIMSAGKNVEPQDRAQKFILGTTVQLLVALFYILFTKFLSPDFFRWMSIHFLIVFFLFLGVQSLVLVLQLRKTN